MSSWEREMAQPLTSQTGHRHGYRFEEETEKMRERLSSLIDRTPFFEYFGAPQIGEYFGAPQIGEYFGAPQIGDCFWMLLADSSTNRFVILQGCWVADKLLNDDFKLVAAGNEACDCYSVYLPGAKDLACVVHKIMMRKKRNEANDSDIVQECAFHGLLIYDLVIDNTFSLRSGLQMPPSVLAADSRLMIAQGPLGTVASSSAPLMYYGPWAAPRFFHRELGGGAAAPVQQPSEVSQRLDAGMVQAYGHWAAVRRAPRYLIESLVWHLFLVLIWRSEYDVRRLRSSAHYDMEEGGQAPWVGGGAAAPVQQPSEVSQRLDAVMVQAYAAFIPACVTAYPLLKDAPDYIKFIIFGGLAFTNLGLFIGILSNSVARRGLAIRLVSFSAIAVLTFCVASQLSSRIYVALTALVGVVLNLIIMLLPS